MIELLLLNENEMVIMLSDEKQLEHSIGKIGFLV